MVLLLVAYCSGFYVPHSLYFSSQSLIFFYSPFIFYYMFAIWYCDISTFSYYACLLPPRVVCDLYLFVCHDLEVPHYFYLNSCFLPLALWRYMLSCLPCSAGICFDGLLLLGWYALCCRSLLLSCDMHSLCGHGRNFVAKCGGGTLVWIQYSHQVDAEVKFYIYTFPVLCLEVFWGQH